MDQPVVHFEIIGRDPASLRKFYAEIFGWTFETEGPAAKEIVGDYGFVAPTMTSAGNGIPGGVGGGPAFEDRVLFYVGVLDVEAALRSAEERGGSRIIGSHQEPESDQLMSGFAAQFESESGDSEEAASLDELTAAPKVVFSSTLQPPLSWSNTRLVNGSAEEAVESMKQDGIKMGTFGSVALRRWLLNAGLVNRFRLGRIPSDNREHRPQQDLRLSRRRTRNGCQPHIRRQTLTARVRPNCARWSSRHELQRLILDGENHRSVAA